MPGGRSRVPHNHLDCTHTDPAVLLEALSQSCLAVLCLQHAVFLLLGQQGGCEPCAVVTGRMLPSEGRVGELAGCEAIRSHCPARGNSNFYEHLNDNTSP